MNMWKLYHRSTRIAKNSRKTHYEPLQTALLDWNLFVSGAEFEPDGGADEAEGGADLVGEEALEGEVELDVAVGEEDEGGRGDGGLGHVIDFDAAVHGDGGALEVDVGEEAVHLAGGDALAALAGDEFDLAEELLDAEAGGGGDEDEWGVVEELEVGTELGFEELLIGFGWGGVLRIPPLAGRRQGWGTRNPTHR